MARIREEKKRKSRKAIIAAAVKLFGEKGYEVTSIQELAKEAGIGKSTVYTYFATKSEIFLAFCEDELEQLIGALSQKCDRLNTLLDQLLALFMGEFSYVTRNKDFGRVLMREMVFPKELTVEKSNDLDNRYLDLLNGMFKQAQERGELRRDLELLLTAAHFYSLYIVTVSAWYGGRLETDEDVFEGMKMLFEQALVGLAPKETENVRMGNATIGKIL